jgi:enoyl-CoA hydratase/carnithine racemase
MLIDGKFIESQTSSIISRDYRMQSLIVRNDSEGVATLTLNRPETLNALSVPVFRELRQHISDIRQQTASIRVVVLRGAGRSFSAGHDLNDLRLGEESPHPHFQAQTIEDLASLPQPVIAAIHGHCYTGALELALAADILLCGKSARFSDTHAKWALAPIWGMSQRLPRRIGLAKAREMMLTGETYTGDEALTMSLVNACVPDEQLDQAVAEWCGRITANSSFSLCGIKRLLDETDGMTLAGGLAYENYHTPGVGPDMQSRIDAFLKRPKRS